MRTTKKILFLIISLGFYVYLLTSCKSIDESIQPTTVDTSKSYRLESVPEANGSATFALGDVSEECRSSIFSDSYIQGSLAVKSIQWVESFMQGRFLINTQSDFKSEPYRSYELMLASAVASKEGWESNVNLPLNDRLYLGLRGVNKIASNSCNDYSSSEELYYYQRVVGKGYELWFYNKDLSFEQLADLVEIELQKDEFVTTLTEKALIKNANTQLIENIGWVPLSANTFKEWCEQNGVLTELMNRYWYDQGLAYGQFNFVMGRIFEDAVLRSLDRPKNTEKFMVSDPTLSPQGVIPDAIAEFGFEKQEKRGGKIVTRYEWWKKSVFLDAKYTRTGIVPYERTGTSPDQAAGFIDVLSRVSEGKYTYNPLSAYLDYGEFSGTPFIKNASQAGATLLIYITPADVDIDPILLQQASLKNILVLQSKVEYHIQTHQIRVGLSYRKNNESVKNYKPLMVSYYGSPVEINFSKK